MMCSIDKGYFEASREYILKWIEEADKKTLKITEDAIAYIIENGGNGLCELENFVHKLIGATIEGGIEEITTDYIKIVHSK